MFDIIKAVIIGIVEGLTEFLPISSTGHIDLVNHVIKLSQSQDFINMFEYVIQFGAILAVILLYFNKLNPFSKPTAKARNATWQLWAKVIIAVLPSVVVGLPLNNWMDEHLHTPLVVATTLIIYGVLFIILENYLKNKNAHITTLADITYQTALLIGLFQVLSIVPGTSRSGATILGALLIGTSRYVATEFSFWQYRPWLACRFLKSANTCGKATASLVNNGLF